MHIQDKNQQIFREPGLRGTLAMLIGDSVIPGYAAYATLEKAVQQALAKSTH
ncbi:UDP-N-acetylmuramoylalanine--D-glutamate ligase [gamma proteobacterium IMCC2047]|nr:UDP-N-acetylmuramoylalanine--D-glutamate ligase [gamma proteobacterium IMCC2047]